MDQRVCDLLKVIGEASRFRIMRYLADRPRNVSEIVRAVGLQQSLVSHHLKVLRDNGLLKAERKGPFVNYSVSCPETTQIFLLAEKIATGKCAEKGERSWLTRTTPPG